MDIIKDLVQTLIIIVVLAVFLEMLLPHGKMAPYLKMVMGLLIIIAVLQGINSFFGNTWLGDLPTVTGGQQGGMAMENVVAAGSELQEKNQELILEKYKQGISGQILALAKLNPQAKVVQARVELSSEQSEQDYGRIAGITLVVDPFLKQVNKGDSEKEATINPVEISVNDGPRMDRNTPTSEVPVEIKKAAGDVAESVAAFYGLSPEKVSVEYRRLTGRDTSE